MSTMKIKKDFITFLKGAPAGLPYFGPVFSQFISEKDSEEIKLLLKDLKKSNEKQLKKLEEEHHIDHKRYIEAVLMLESYINEKNKTNKLNVIIPTGGEGESMFPITSMIPKSLIPIGEKPMLLHIIDSLLRFPSIFNRVIVITNENSPAIEYALNQSKFKDIVDCRHIEKNVPGALLEIKHIINNRPFLLHYNDILIKNINWEEVLANYVLLKTQRAIIGLVLCSKYYPLGIGVDRERQDGLLEIIDEKPDFLIDFYANMGVAIFEPCFLNYVDKDDEGIFENSVNRAIDDNKTIGMFKVDKWYHVHDLKDYRFVQNEY